MTDEGTRLAVEAHRDVTVRLDALAGELPDADRDRLASVIARLLSRHGALTGHPRDLAR
ncbi:hypothetical protein [Streptosporangium sp. NPDC002607]